MKYLFWICFIFCSILIILPFLFCDFWMDEIISIWDYISLPHFKDVFMHYSEANNHIYFSALLWLWRSLFDVRTSEFLMRIPCLIFWCFLLISCIYYGKIYFPNWWRLLLLIFAFSPICLSFAFQLRGYSWSLFLGILFTFGVLDIIHNHYIHGCIVSGLSCFFLIGIIPSNMLLICAGILFLFIVSLKNHSKNIFYCCLFLSILFILSFFPYFLNWKDFCRIMNIPTQALLGKTLLDVLLGLFFHLLILLLLLCRFHSRSSIGLIMLIVAIIGLFSSLYLSKQVPFSRVYLILFPWVTIAFLYFIESSQHENKWSELQWCILLFCFVGFFLVFDSMTNFITKKNVENGILPQNLSMQFYKKNSNASKFVQKIIATPQYRKNSFFVASFMPFVAFRHYAVLAGYNPLYIIDARDTSKLSALKNRNIHFYIVASSSQEAQRMATSIINNSVVSCELSYGMYQLYSISFPNSACLNCQ